MSTNATFPLYFQPGIAANLSCAATGVPQPTIAGLSPSFNSTTNAYTFPNVSQSNAGSYICVASNSVGSNTITYMLNVGGENINIWDSSHDNCPSFNISKMLYV